MDNEENFPTFSVELEKVWINRTYRYEVNSDGTRASEQYEVDADDMATHILVGYVVMEREDGCYLSNVEFYPITSDTTETEVDAEGDRVYKNNAEEVLDKIKEKYTPDKWENFNW